MPDYASAARLPAWLDRSIRCKPWRNSEWWSDRRWESGCRSSRAAACHPGLSWKQADGEQLHQLARVILVGPGVAGWVGLVVVPHVQVLAHGGAERDIFHQRAEVREGIVLQDLQVRHQLCGRIFLDGGNHEHSLAQREGHALAQLILAVNGVGEKTRLHLIDAEGCGGGVRIRGNGRRELFVQVSVQPHRLYVRNRRRVGTKRSLVEEARRHVKRHDRRSRRMPRPSHSQASTEVAEPGSGFVTTTGKLWPVCAAEESPVAVSLVAET